MLKNVLKKKKKKRYLGGKLRVVSSSDTSKTSVQPEVL